MAENGINPNNLYLMVPIADMSRPDAGEPYNVAIFDVLSFDDPMAASSYSYRKEDIAANRVPTARRVLIQHRDLGPATLTVTISGVNDNGLVVSVSKSITIGTKAASLDILTAFVDITLTAFHPQLSITRSPAGGPFAIVSATMVGEIEESQL